LTGALTLPSSVVNPRHAATKQYVDNAVDSLQNVFIGTTEPSVQTGEQVLWLDTTGGNFTLNLVEGD
jgi:hypothetical protein